VLLAGEGIERHGCVGSEPVHELPDGGDRLGGCSVANEVVAHYLDGRVVKGVSHDIDPARPTCHIRTPDRQSIEVKLADLKALFFVKSLAGDPTYKEGSTVEAGDQRARGAYRIEVQFADGERVVGMTVRYPPVRPFFYVVPADGRSNNLRILINRAAVVRFGQPPSETPL
jgi:hypothetical protein